MCLFAVMTEGLHPIVMMSDSSMSTASPIHTVLALVRRHGMAYQVRLSTSRNPVTMGDTAMKGTEAMDTADTVVVDMVVEVVVGTAVEVVDTGTEEECTVDMIMEATDV